MNTQSFDKIFLLLDDHINQKGLLFENPCETILCQHPYTITQSLEKIDTLREKGLFLAGYIAYEIGYYLPHFTTSSHKNITPPLKTDTPLIEFYAFTSCQQLASKEIESFLHQRQNQTFAQPTVFSFEPHISHETYEKNFQTITNALLSGEIYQINYTFPLHFQLQGSALYLYKKLREKQKTAYSAFLSLKNRYILSLSPELFFKKTESRIETRPMKGTLKRGKNNTEDALLKASMLKDIKTRAENLMIVDLLRNDLSRIAKDHSVQVEKLFEIETYATLHQLVSSITAKIPPAQKLSTIIEALFPCGSVTGAPKYTAMKLIKALENTPRGVYTGAIGYLSPDNNMCFNVPIRTLSISPSGQGSMSVGSGIVADSDVKEEWKECLLKADFLKSINTHFQLIEALLLPKLASLSAPRMPKNFHIHLERLENSARVFGFSFFKNTLVQAVEEFCRSPSLPSASQKIRILLYQDGRFDITASEGESSSIPQYVRLELQERVSSSDIFLYHKTTHRPLYTKHWEICQKAGIYDCLFLNEKGNVTEATRHNLFIKKDHIYYTPFLKAGLLNGTVRAQLLNDQPHLYKEKELTINDIINADALYLTNAVRGVVKVDLCLETRQILKM